MGNNKVYRQLTSVKTDANSLLISDFNLGNDASQIGKLGADVIFCPFLCVQKINLLWMGNDRVELRFSKPLLQF